MVYDVAVIGTGPAGVSAVLNLKIHEKNFVWLGSQTLSDKVKKAEQIANYPGFSAVTGTTLNDAFQKQIQEMGITIEEHMVNSIQKFGDHYALLAGSEFYEAKTLLLATGIAAAGTLPGETELLGKGVSYCATCDGMLYRDRIIAVTSNNSRFEHEVQYLANLAKKVYFFPAYPNASQIADNVEVSYQRITKINGQERVTDIVCKDGQTISVDGVFCLRDSIALTTLLPGLELENGHIAVDRNMATNLAGVYAAGDCTGRPYQYAKAIGEGNVAAHSIIDYFGKSHNVSDETIENVAVLSKLELDAKEKHQAKQDMEKMLTHIDKIEELDTAGIEPASHIFPLENVFREDEVINAEGSKELLSNAPQKNEKGIVVPKTISGDE